MYSFISKTKAGYILEVRTSFDYSCGRDVSRAIYATKPLAKAAAKLVNAKPWNY